MRIPLITLIIITRWKRGVFTLTFLEFDFYASGGEWIFYLFMGVGEPHTLATYFVSSHRDNFKDKSYRFNYKTPMEIPRYLYHTISF